MTFDPDVPKALKEIQLWFAKTITEPLLHLNDLQGNPRAEKYLLPTDTLSPNARITIYCQQYWWRLLGILHKIFPTATRLIGYRSFNNDLAIPYLTASPPQHWSFVRFGKDFPAQAAGRANPLVIDCLRLDWAYQDAFFAADPQPIVLEGQDPQKLFETKSTLSPNLSLLTFPYHLPNFRKELKKKEPDFWSAHHATAADEEEQRPLPALKKGKMRHFAIYRNVRNCVAFAELSNEEKSALLLLEKESSLSKLCEMLASQTGKKLPPLNVWIERWVAKRWIQLVD